MEAPPTRLPSAGCAASSCGSAERIYACCACGKRLYCSIACQQEDWESHCCAGKPDSIGWLSANVRLQPRAHGLGNEDSPERHGYTGSFNDIHTLAVTVGSRCAQLSFDCTARASYDGGDIHKFISEHTRSRVPSDSRRSAVPEYYAHWRERNVTLDRLSQALCSGLSTGQLPVQLHRVTGLQLSDEATFAFLLTERPRYSMHDMYKRGSITARQVSQFVAQTIGLLGVLGEAGLTHGNLSTETIRLIPTVLPLVTYEFDGGRHYVLHTLGYRAVLTNFENSSLRDLQIDHEIPDVWPVQPSAIHLPNYSNPGYDMWLLAVSLIANTIDGCLPPRIVHHMIPRRDQINRLFEHVVTENSLGVDKLIQVLRLARETATIWTNIDLWDQVRAAIARPPHFWRIPWPPQFYRTPSESLQAFGVVPFPAGRPLCPGTDVILWDK